MKQQPEQPTPFGRALRNVGWLLTGKGVGALLSLVYLALATRSLGIQHFGEFTLILSTAQAVAALVGFQTWQIVVRYGMPHLQAERDAPLARLVRFCAVLDLSAALLGCVIAVGALLAMRVHFGWSAAFTRNAVIFAVVLLLSFRSTAIGVLRLHDRYRVAAGADAVTPVVRFVGAIVAVWQDATVAGFLIAWAASEVLTAAVYWITAARAAPGLLRGGRGFMRAGHENDGLWHFALVTNLNSTLNAVSRQFVVILVGLFTGAAAAGAYRLAYQISQSLVRASDMFSRGVFPEVSRADAAQAHDSLALLRRQSARLAIAAGVLTCILVPLLGQPLLHLVAGKSYLGAYPILVLLGIAAGLDIMAVGFEPVLMATGHARQALYVRIAAAVALFTGVAILLPRYDTIGAGIATLIASALALVLFVQAAIRLTRQRRRMGTN